MTKKDAQKKFDLRTQVFWFRLVADNLLVEFGTTYLTKSVSKLDVIQVAYDLKNFSLEVVYYRIKILWKFYMISSYVIFFLFLQRAAEEKEFVASAKT